MGKPKKAKLPPAPDPKALIAEQAQANRINQTTPFGNISYSGPNRSDLTYSLSPQYQALLDAQTGFGTAAAQQGKQFLGASNLTPVGLQDVTKIGQSLYDMGLSRAQPYFDQQDSRLREQLTQGGNNAVGADLAPGAVSELDLSGRQRNQFLSDLALNSITQATGQRGQLMAQDLGVQQGNAQIAAMLGQAGQYPQVPGLDSFIPPGSLDVNGAYQTANAAAQARAELQQKQRSGWFGGLFDLGAAGLSFFNPAAGAAMGGFGGLIK